MGKFFTFILILLLYNEISAGNARQTAKGNVGATSLGADANYSNPAGLAWRTHHVVGTTYASHHLISALDKSFLSYSKSKKDKAVGFYFTRTGDRRLQHNALSLTYAQLFSNKFSLALRAGLNQLEFSENYGKKTLPFVDIGLLTQLNEKLNLGFYILNAGRSQLIKEYKERMESALITGLSYTSSELFSLELELEKFMTHALNIKLGVEYEPLQSFFLRGGFQSAYRRFSTGFGYRGKRIGFDSTMYYSPSIGYSLIFSLSVHIEKLS